MKKAFRLSWPNRCWSAVLLSALFAFTATPDVALANSACDRFLEDMPKRGPERIAAGRPYLDELPGLSRVEQTRIVRHYAKTLPDYIAPAEIDSVVDDLPEERVTGTGGVGGAQGIHKAANLARSTPQASQADTEDVAILGPPNAGSVNAVARDSAVR